MYETATPYGRLPFARWQCQECDAYGHSTAPGAADAFRELAASHVRSTGHQVDYQRGTTEMIVPLATEAPRG